MCRTNAKSCEPEGPQDLTHRPSHFGKRVSSETSGTADSRRARERQARVLRGSSQALRRITAHPCFMCKFAFTIGHVTWNLKRHALPRCASRISNTQHECQVVENQDESRVAEIVPVCGYVSHFLLCPSLTVCPARGSTIPRTRDWKG